MSEKGKEALEGGVKSAKGASRAVKGKKSDKAAEQTKAASNVVSVAALTTEQIVERFKRAEGDTGSPEVQIALLTNRIENLTQHFGVHKKDHHSRQGMYRQIAKRKSLLTYLRGENVDRYRTLVADLGLRK